MYNHQHSGKISVCECVFGTWICVSLSFVNDSLSATTRAVFFCIVIKKIGKFHINLNWHIIRIARCHRYVYVYVTVGVKSVGEPFGSKTRPERSYFFAQPILNPTVFPSPLSHWAHSSVCSPKRMNYRSSTGHKTMKEQIKIVRTTQRLIHINFEKHEPKIFGLIHNILPQEDPLRQVDESYIFKRA